MPPPPTTSSGQHVLQPNRAPSTRKEYSVMVEVSSRDRNYLQLVKSNPMRFQLQRPLKDVRSIELVSGTIPANPCQLNPHNNRFDFLEGTTRFTLIIPPGYYSIQTLLTQIETLLNAVTTATYTLTLTTLPDGEHVLITSNTPLLKFGLLFFSGSTSDLIDRSDGYLLEQNTPALLLGFDLTDYFSISGGTLMAPNTYDLNASLTRLYLYIDFNNAQSLATIERGAGRKSPFAIIYLDQQTNGYKFLNKETMTPVHLSLPQPFSRLQALHIEFRDEFSRTIDFHGRDFSLLLQFNCLE